MHKIKFYQKTFSTIACQFLFFSFGLRAGIQAHPFGEYCMRLPSLLLIQERSWLIISNYYSTTEVPEAYTSDFVTSCDVIAAMLEGKNCFIVSALQHGRRENPLSGQCICSFSFAIYGIPIQIFDSQVGGTFRSAGTTCMNHALHGAPPEDALVKIELCKVHLVMCLAQGKNK